MKRTNSLFILLLISCFSNAQGVKTIAKKVDSTMNNSYGNEQSFEERQDSLRTILLDSKPNENLKSSLLQELYIRGLVDQKGSEIIFQLPFNLHGFDCGAPDCYSTNISFQFEAKEPIIFPKKIQFKLLETGCGIEEEKLIVDEFELVEQGPKSVNYYSKRQKSNLVIVAGKGGLYYFPDSEPNAIRVRLLAKIMNEFKEDDSNTNVPFQSTTMTTNEYEHFFSVRD